MNTSKNFQDSKRELLKTPVTCPWVANQPYPSALSNKNKSSIQRRNSTAQTNNCLNNHWNESANQQNGCNLPKETSSFSSMQQSSNQFFLFLRLMQLFPHTHPATLHTVLYICKNDFFCAIDKLLYAKRCKMLYGNNSRSNGQLHVTNERFKVITPIQCAKRPFAKCQMKNEDDSERDAKMIKINAEDIQNDTRSESMNGINKIEIVETDSEPISEFGPVETIELITIKTNDLQEKVDIAELGQVDLKFSQEIS